MDPRNCDPFSSGPRSSNHLLGGQQAAQGAQANEAGQTDFEQRLGEAAEAAVARDTPRPAYPQLSSEDESLIEAVETDAVRRNLQEQTARNYAFSLRKLGNHLVCRGKTISGLDQTSLLDHAWLYFPADEQMRHALGALHKYREPRVADGDRHYVPPADKILIDCAVQAAAARRGWAPLTAEKYDRVLRRLAKSLESQGQTMAALDHNALLVHAKGMFGNDNEMDAALLVLREHREPGILAARRPREDQAPAAEDKCLIEAAARTSARPKKAIDVYVKNLLRFAGALNADGQRMTNLEYPELVKLAKERFPGNGSIVSGLGMVRDYRNAERASGRAAPWHAEDDPVVASPELSFDPEELWRLLEDQPVPPLPLHNSAGLRDASDDPDQLRAESLNTATLREMLVSPAGSPLDSVNQPDPAVPSPVQIVDPEGIWPSMGQAGLSPVESFDTAKLLEIFASPRHSPTDSVNQPDTSPPWDVGGSSSGAPCDAVRSLPGFPDAELDLPKGWQHGDQWASPDLKEEMRLHDVLPSASQPETNLTISGVNYTAMLGPPGLENEIFLRRT
ncbi:hypothetical protein [Bradyrhizobium pachyrhizi]|uniref:hypothetical protein n=1 Tax=Bradyrhizobium pachyrhizi TaxID=280333 RepID=UPI000B0DEF09|nr:hypothetical protein [Bradyrhizobium pachyrhizi]